MVLDLRLQSFLDSEKYKAEVDKDLADAATVGATGTPTFFIGKSTTDGIITGTKIVGAQPFSAFKAEIDKQLN
jgi:protein-disulfide isomerase